MCSPIQNANATQANTVSGIFHVFHEQCLEFRTAVIDCLSRRTPVTTAQHSPYARNSAKCQHTCRIMSTTSAARSIIREAVEALDIMGPSIIVLGSLGSGLDARRPVGRSAGRSSSSVRSDEERFPALKSGKFEPCQHDRKSASASLCRGDGRGRIREQDPRHSFKEISFTNKRQLLHQSIRYIRFVPRNTTDTMKLSPTLCLVAAASFVAKADEVAILEDTPEARLIKDHDPIAEATYHESDPVVQDSVGSDSLPRLVRNRGPLTKKVVASASHFPGLDFSLVAWKFTDGSFKGSMEEKLDNGEVLVKVDVDCMAVENGRAIVGGTISKTSRKGPDAFLFKRAHAVVVDEGLTEEVSGLLVGLPEDVDCDNLAESVDHGSVQMHPGSATVCNRRDGEAAWLDCVDSLKKTA